MSSTLNLIYLQKLTEQRWGGQKNKTSPVWFNNNQFSLIKSRAATSNYLSLSSSADYFLILFCIEKVRKLEKRAIFRKLKLTFSNVVFCWTYSPKHKNVSFTMIKTRKSNTSSVFLLCWLTKTFNCLIISALIWSYFMVSVSLLETILNAM